MADNTEETKPDESASADSVDSANSLDASGMTSDQSFTYWLTMLPFLAIAAVFVYDFSKTHGEYTKLINAAGAIVVGIFVASFVNVLSQGSDHKEDSGTKSDAPKAEGTH